MTAFRLKAFLLLVGLWPLCHSFLLDGRPRRCATVVTPTLAASNTADMQDNFLLEEFKIHSGEVINPYQVLKVSRKADRSEIKKSYRNLSRRYHPDGNMHRRDILPGSCNNWEEVRDHWERVKLSYEILSDPKRRKRYDRHEALADPGAAMKRAAVNAAFSGVANVGKGIFSMGNFAFQQMKENTSKNDEMANGEKVN